MFRHCYRSFSTCDALSGLIKNDFYDSGRLWYPIMQVKPMLRGFQKQYLKRLAHGMKPVVFIGQKGLTPTLVKAMNNALDTHELIKVRFIDFKEKKQKEMLASEIEKIHDCQKVGMVGHVAIFYREQKDPEKRKIVLQEKTGENVE